VLARNAVDMRNVIIWLALVILLAAGTAYAVYALLGVEFGWRSAPAGPGGVPGLADPGPMLAAGTFTVNLTAGNMPAARYVRTEIVLEVESEAVLAALQARMPQVRDRIIDVLRQQTVESLHGSDGLGRLKQALRTRVDELVGAGTVREVYFVDLVVQ